MFLIKMALRNVLRQRRRSILTGLTIIVGFFLLSISIGLAEGSYSLIINLFTGDHTGHIQIHREDYRNRPSLYKTFSATEGDKLARFPFVQSWAPRVYAPALAFHNDKAIGIQIIGVDNVKEPQTTSFQRKISSGNLTTTGVVVSFGMTRVLNLNIGDSLVLISQGADGSIANDIFPVVGIIGSKTDTDTTMLCYLNITTAQQFLSLGDKIHEIAIMTNTYSKAPLYANILRKDFKDPNLDIQPWQVVEKYFYDAMRADIKGMWISIVIIMIIVALGVLDTVLMSLLERTYEFGILKALGTRASTLFTLIMSEVSLLSILSIVAGSLISAIAHWWFTAYGIDLPEPIEFGGVQFTSYRSTIAFNTYWIPAVLTLITSLIVTLFPTIGVMRRAPVKALRQF